MRVLSNGANVTVYRGCASNWWVGLLGATGEQWRKLDAFRDQYPGWQPGFASRETAEQCARDFVAAESALESGAA